MAAKRSSSFTASFTAARCASTIRESSRNERRNGNRLRRGEGEIEEHAPIGNLGFVAICISTRTIEPLRESFARLRMLILAKLQKFIFADRCSANSRRPAPIPIHSPTTCSDSL